MTRAAIALHRRQPEQAITALEAAAPPDKADVLALDPSPFAPKGEALKAFLAAQQPRLQVAPVRARPLSPGQKLLDALHRRTGVHRNHLRVGLQGVLGYFVIMLLVVVPAANDAFDHRMLWGLIIVITVLEPMTGQVMIKGLQRLLGTALGAGLGVGIMYFTYLCNGLTYSSAHVQKVRVKDACWGGGRGRLDKGQGLVSGWSLIMLLATLHLHRVFIPLCAQYIVMTISLSLAIGVLGYCAARWTVWLCAQREDEGRCV